MVARAFLSLVILLHAGSPVWAFSGAHGKTDPLPEPQISKFRQDNCDNLERLKPGMNRQEASSVMGDRKDVQLFNLYKKAEVLSNPQMTETLSGKDRKKYEVDYYFAYQKKADNKITKDELCRVIFRDGKLEGWGWDYYEMEIGAVPAGP